MKTPKAHEASATVDFAFRVASSVAEAVEKAAQRELITKTAFARRAVLRDLAATQTKEGAAA